MKINSTNPDKATLRDEIAMRVVAAMVGADALRRRDCGEICEAAYAVADAMLEARKK